MDDQFKVRFKSLEVHFHNVQKLVESSGWREEGKKHIQHI